MKYSFTNETFNPVENYYIYIIIGLLLVFVFMYYKINKSAPEVIFQDNNINQNGKKCGY